MYQFHFKWAWKDHSLFKFGFGIVRNHFELPNFNDQNSSYQAKSIKYSALFTKCKQIKAYLTVNPFCLLQICKMISMKNLRFLWNHFNWTFTFIFSASWQTASIIMWFVLITYIEQSTRIQTPAFIYTYYLYSLIMLWAMSCKMFCK